MERSAHAHGTKRTYRLNDTFRATVLTTAKDTDGRYDITDGVMAPFSSTPLHLHTRYDERFFVVCGSMTIWAGAARVELGPGDFYAVARGTPHVIEAGADGARSLNISSPAAFADLVARSGSDADEPLTDADSTMRFAQLSAALGDVILGPPGTRP